MSNLDADGVENTPLNQILIHDLVETQPLDTDSEGRLPSILVIIKNALHNTFPNIGNSQINTRAKEFNNVVKSLQPSCGIIYWVDHHDVTKLGKGWSFCDGSNHTLSNGQSVTTPKVDSMFLHDRNDRKRLDSNQQTVHFQGSSNNNETGNHKVIERSKGFQLQEKHVAEHHHKMTTTTIHVRSSHPLYHGANRSHGNNRNPHAGKTGYPLEMAGGNGQHFHKCNFNNKPDHVILNPITYIGY